VPTEKPKAADPETQGDADTLRALLDELEPHISKRKPKPAKKVAVRIEGYAWGEPFADDVRELCGLVKRYRFKECTEIVERLRKKLGGG